MPTSYGVLAFRKLPQVRIEKCLAQPLPLPDCKICIQKLSDKNRFLQPTVERAIEKDELQLLCILRRDSHALVDLLRGRYPRHSILFGDHKASHLINIWLNETTCNEQQWLFTMSFHTIWKLMFKRKATEYQEKLHCHLMDYIRRSLYRRSDNHHHPYPEFGIPKGRIEKQDENGFQCAIREFTEETGYKLTDLKFDNTNKTFLEDFVGTNMVPYKHIYWIAEINAENQIPDMTTSQLGEIQNIGWFTESEILASLRPYDTVKAKIIRDAFQYMRSSSKVKFQSPKQNDKQPGFEGLPQVDVRV